MSAISVVHGTEYRLATYYLAKLREAAQAVRRGRASLEFGLSLFEREWLHIQHWQHWSNEQRDADEAVVRLCMEFPLAGLDVLYIRQNPTEQISWLETALAAAERLRHEPAQRALLFPLFKACFSVNALDKAEHYARRLTETAKKTGDRLHYARGTYGLGSIYEERGAYAEARACYQQSLEIFEDLGADADAGDILNGLGAVALYLGEYQQAHHYFSRHLALAEAVGNPGDISRALLAVGEGLWGLNDFVAAEQVARRAIDLCRALGYQRMLGAGLLALGAYLLEQNELEAANAQYEEGIRVSRACGAERNVIHGLLSLGYAEFRLGRYSDALAHLSESLALARRAGQPRFVCNIQRTMTNIYLATGDLYRARESLRESLILAEALASEFQKVRTLCSAIWLWHMQGLTEQAAMWSGLVEGRTDIDTPVFQPIFDALEAELGAERYKSALGQGREQRLDDVVAELVILLG